MFSVCSQPVEKLSSFIQHLYLGPIVNSGVLKWRLKDTKDFITFIHDVNTFISANNITSPPIICSIDIKNMFPSIFKDLALPAIKQRLLGHGFSTDESNAVVSALEIVRDGTRALWRDEVVRQKDGCSLGPSDSCDYADIALDAFLQVLVPRLECQLKVDLSFLGFYRDDVFMGLFEEGRIVLDILNILNCERQELKFTTEFCPCGEVLGTCSSCPKKIPFLDCMVSLHSLTKESGITVQQLMTQTYAKPTDIHKYIHPSSSTPNLSVRSPSIIKGVAHILRLTNTEYEDSLTALHTLKHQVMTGRQS